MSDQKHVHVEDRYIKTTDGYLAISGYVLDSFLGLTWLPDKSIFETDLVIMYIEKGKEEAGVCAYHSGVMHHSAMALSHIAGLASSLYGATKGKRPYDPKWAQNYADNFQNDYVELRSFPDRGYYRGKKLVFQGKIHKGDLLE